jgi:hypothetical protein
VSALVRRRSRAPARLMATAVAAVMLSALACAQSAPRITTAVDWTGRGTWIKADLHTHSKLSDGNHAIEEIVSSAEKNGCEAIAIADHSDPGLKGAGPEYLEAVRTARTAHPGVIIPAAFEWNVPPGKGDEHAIVVLPTAMEDGETLASFKQKFDDEDKKGENADLAPQGFAALAPATRDAVAPVVFFSHPGRRPGSPSLPASTIAGLKKGAPTILMGVEGGPGHQKGSPLGSYKDQSFLIDRWDTVVSSLGGAWDQWLGQGLTLWGALTNSDFHNVNDGFWPCEFSATWVYVPERSVTGVIRALRAGSFFGEHGHIVTEAMLQVRFDGMPRPAGAGETVAAATGAKGTAMLQLDVPATDYAGQPNRIDLVELIAITPSKTEVIFSGPPAGDKAFEVAITVPPGGLVLRARGKRNVEGGPGLMFYTNPIRVTVPSR